jgi:polysaccharide biosynthesis/export protein
MKIRILLPVFALFLAALNIPNTAAQDLTDILADEVTKTLTSGSKSRKDEERFTSFIQNEYQNTVKQLKKIDKDIESTLFQTNLQRERIKMASQLCSLDPRACFLIEEYQLYSESQVPNSIDELEIFGTDYFTGYPIDMNAFDNLPIQDSYILSIGDYINISSFGILNFDEEVEVDLTGSLLIPQIGLVNIAGMKFSDASKKISDLVSSKFPSTEIYLSLNQIRAIQIFTMGVVNKPGSYSVSSMSTGLNAVITGGGFQKSASLRNISIIRGQENIANIDLYKLLIDGDSSSDIRLKNGDTVLVDGSQNLVSVFGEVHRPAIYEFKNGETLSDILKFSLGFTSFADTENITIKRLTKNNKFETISINNNLDFSLKPGDEIIINPLMGESINNLAVFGALRNTGQFSIEGETSLGAFLTLERDLLEETYTGFGIIKHFDRRTRSWSIEKFNLLDQNTVNNKVVRAGDEIYVFSKADVDFINSISFSKKISEIYNKGKAISSDSLEGIEAPSGMPQSMISQITFSGLENSENMQTAEDQRSQECFNFFGKLNKASFAQSSMTKLEIFDPINKQECPNFFKDKPELLPILLSASIPVVGNVRLPGLYPIDTNVSAKDILNLAGGSIEENLGANIFEAGFLSSEIRTIPLNELSSFKQLTYFSAKASYKSSEQGFVTVEGQFNYPGKYAINSDTTILDIYKRAGNLTQYAFPYGAVLTRKSIKEIEQQSLERAEKELAEVLSTAVTSGYLKQNSTDLVALLALMTSISNTDPIGRLVSEFDPNAIKKNLALNTILEDGDVIYMPRLRNTVTVMGQVLNPVTVPYNSSFSVDDYILAAGGFKDRADKNKTYAILPNGISIDPSNSFINFSSGSKKIVPGATILVPRQARPLDGLSLVEVLTPILANLSVTAASIAAISRD